METKFAFDSIAALFEAVTVKSPDQGRLNLDAFIDLIPEESIGAYVLFSLRGFDYATKLYASSQFESLSQAPELQLAGIQRVVKYRKIPIIEIWGMGSESSPCGVCVPIREIGAWRQYWASSLGEELAVDVAAIDERTATSILADWSSRGHRGSEPAVSDPDAILNLLKKVKVHVWERFVYRPHKGSLGIKIVLPPAH